MSTESTSETGSSPAERVGSGLSAVWTVVVRTVRDSMRDRVPGLAAEISFYLLLSLPPLLLVGLGALGFMGDVFGPEAVAAVQAEIIDVAGQVLTQDTIDEVVTPAVSGLLAQGRADILSLGAILALWSGSRALRVIVEAITIAYDLRDQRTWWQHRLLGLALAVAGVLMLSVLLPLLVVGPQAGEAFAARFGLERAFEVIWEVAYFPVVVSLGLLLLTWVYHIVPPRTTKWWRDLPGAIVAFVLWLGGSAALRIYATEVVSAESAYSYFGTPLALMLWFYVTALTFLVGAEVNAEIEKLWPSTRTDEAAAA